ncbi:MAG TPA: hypothetical protein PK156_22880 [Polyangium sp.]|nr:hypothetical protein [Polyangium sp.]
MNWLQVIQVGATWGVVLSLTFTAAVLVMGRIDVMMLLREYPPDVQAKAGPMPEVSRRRAKRMQIPLVLVSDFVVACGLWQLRSLLGELRFAETFLASTVIFQIWNLIDLLWLDWFILMTLRPRFMILPGTDGLAGYRDYKFHVNKFGRGIVLTTIMALIVTVVAVGLEALI